MSNIVRIIPILYCVILESAKTDVLATILYFAPEAWLPGAFLFIENEL